MAPASRLVLGGWLFLTALAALAQQPALRVYSMSDGLKYSQVFCVFQDRTGFLWAGTSYGVSRYDGREFVTLTRAHGLPHDSVLDIAEDRNGDIWVLTQEGLARVATSETEKGAPRVLDPLPEWRSLPVSTLRRLASAKNGTVWLLGSGNLWRSTVRGLEAVPFRKGLTLEDPVRLGPVSESEAWVAATGVVLKAVVGRAPEEPAWPAEFGSPVALTQLENEILLLQKQGVSVYREGRFEPDPRWKLPSGLNPEGVLAYRDGLVVSTPGQGAVILARDAPPQILSRALGLPSDSVNGAFGDRDGLLWLATEDGLVKVFDFSVESYPSRPPSLGNQILAVTEGSGGAIWIGHSNGLTRLQDSALTLYEPFPERSEENSVWAALPLTPEVVLTGTKRGLVAFLSGKPRWFPGFAFGRRIYGLRMTRDGWIWAGTLNGLVRFHWEATRSEPSDVTVFDQPEKGLYAEIRGLDESPDGSLWIGSDGHGVFRLTGGEVERFGKEAGFPTRVCRAVLGLSSDTALVGTDLGLFRLKAGRASPVEQVNQAFDRPYVVALARGPKNRVWVGLTDRILELEGDTVRRVLDRTSGLVGLTTTAENCLMMDSKGGLWVGMVGGLTRAGLSRAGEARAPDIKILDVESGKGRSIRPGIRLPHDENSVTFSYRSPTFLSEERTRFEERLTGYETTWNLAHLASSQRYTNLEAGDYTLEVRAVSAAGIRSPSATFSFSIAPPWWETVWARVAFVLFAAVMVLSVFRARTFRLRQQARVLQEEVTARTRELAEANWSLQELQDKLSRLVETGGQAREDIRGWAQSQAGDLSRALKAEGISVAELDEAKLTPLFGNVAATAEDIARLTSGAQEVVTEAESFFPIRGASGDLLGVLGIQGHKGPWAEPEKRLIVAFAHQLGGAIEVRRLQQRLQTVESARSAVRIEMEKKGVQTTSVCPKCQRCYPQGTLRCDDDAFLVEEQGLLPLRIQDRYQLLSRLGQGGMGVVYLARDEQLSREVALKIIRPELFDDPGIRLRFRREARAAASIQHPGIISIFDTGELDDGSAFMVMEHLKGIDLARLLTKCGRGRSEDVAALAWQAGAALSAAHRAGIVHRDMKPENLFLLPERERFTVKILDFGLARSLTLGDGLTRTGMVVGTPAYLSPEQVRGEPATPRSDLYSLAVTLWEALTGVKAVTKVVLSELFTEVLQEPIPAVSLLRPGLGEEIDRLFAIALAKSPSERSGDVESWTSHLANLLDSLEDDEPGWRL